MHAFLTFLKGSRHGRQQLEAHRQRLYRIAYAWTHEAALADDLVQETLIKAMQRVSQLRDPKAGEAWLYTILTNCYRDHFRRRRETEDIDALDLTHEHTPEHDAGERNLVLTVRTAISRLPEGQRQVVTLVDLEGFSYVEVSQILDVPIGTVMSRLCRARGALKQLLVHLRASAEETRATNANAQAPEIRLRRIK